MSSRLAALAVAVVVAAGCSSAPPRRVTSAGGAGGAAEETTTSEATTSTVAGAPTTTTLAALAGPTTTTVRAAITPFVGATTTTTRATAAQAAEVTTVPGEPTTAPSPSTTVPPASTTTTTALRQLSALNLSASCDEASPGNPSSGVVAVPEAVDLDKLRSDLAAQGYALPSGFQFKWGGTHALTPAAARNLSDAQAKINQCATDSGGSATLTVWRVQGEQGSDLFAGMVKQQLDDLHFKNNKSVTVS